jgi:hypothetical protein
MWIASSRASITTNSSSSPEPGKPDVYEHALEQSVRRKPEGHPRLPKQTRGASRLKSNNSDRNDRMS